MPKKSYCQHCGLARALDVVGERWSLLIVRNLLLGPRRYGDLMAELPGITTNLLAKRLREMTKAGLVAKREKPPPNAGTLYELTEGGASLEPAVHALGAWGGRYMGRMKAGDTANLGWGLFSLKRRYRGGLTGSLALITETRRYTMRFRGETMSVRDDDEAAVDVTIAGNSKTLREALVGGDVDAKERLTVEGDHRLLARMLRAFDSGPVQAA